MDKNLTGRLVELTRDLLSEENAGKTGLAALGLGITAWNAFMRAPICNGADQLRTHENPYVRAAFWGSAALTAGHVTRAIPNRYDPLSLMGSLLAKGGKWRNRI